MAGLQGFRGGGITGTEAVVDAGHEGVEKVGPAIALNVHGIDATATAGRAAVLEHAIGGERGHAGPGKLTDWGNGGIEQFGVRPPERIAQKIRCRGFGQSPAQLVAVLFRSLAGVRGGQRSPDGLLRRQPIAPLAISTPEGVDGLQVSTGQVGDIVSFDVGIGVVVARRQAHQNRDGFQVGGLPIAVSQGVLQPSIIDLDDCASGGVKGQTFDHGLKVLSHGVIGVAVLDLQLYHVAVGLSEEHYVRFVQAGGGIGDRALTRDRGHRAGSGGEFHPIAQGPTRRILPNVNADVGRRFGRGGRVVHHAKGGVVCDFPQVEADLQGGFW